MKVLFLSCLLTLSTLTFAQPGDCKALHAGTFNITTPGLGTVTITRTATEQLEKSENGEFEVLFSIKWLDDCIYELRPKKVIRGNAGMMQGPPLISRVKKITAKSYFADCQFEGTEEIVEFEIFIGK